MQREQLEQLLSSNSMLRSTFLMLYLKEDNVEAFFTLLGTELHTFGPIYLSECFPKETVLNLGIVRSLLCLKTLWKLHKLTMELHSQTNLGTPMETTQLLLLLA